MAISITISIDQNSQNIANNTSNVTVVVRAKWTGGSYNQLQKPGWLKIDGTQYNFTSSFNYNRATSGTQELFTKTVDVEHNDDGTKTLDCSASYTSGVSSGTVGASASKVLTTIARKSTLSVSNGTLGTAQTLTISEKASSLTHKLYYTCGSVGTTYILGSASATSSTLSTSWTPPLSLANQNTTGSSVTIKFTLDTYSGSTKIGTNTYSKTFTIPASVKPSCSIEVSDPTGLLGTYGGYIQNVSKFAVKVTAEASYGAAISTYKTTANGSTYVNSSFTTDILTASGNVSISTTVTDKRGRTGTASKSVTVLAYSLPKITALSVHRCDANGTRNDKGEYVIVNFNASVTSVSGKNTPTYTLQYKKTSDSNYTTVQLTNYSSNYSVSNGSYIFAADSGASYNVILSVTDKISSDSKTTTASTGFTLMHWLASGLGMGIGKIAELTNVLDIAFKTRFYGGILPVMLESGTDLNSVTTPNVYLLKSGNSYVNTPVTGGTIRFEVFGTDTALMQRFSIISKTNPRTYERAYYSDGWGEWTHAVPNFDSGWQYPTALGEYFKQYGSSSDNTVKYRKVGKIVEVRGIVTYNDASSDTLYGGTDIQSIFTLPYGYRPSTPIYAVCHGSGAVTWLLSVKPNGEVGFSRYYNPGTGTYEDFPADNANPWLPFQATYFID